MSDYLLERRRQKLGIVTVEKVKEIAKPVKKTPIKKRSKKMTKEMKLYLKDKKNFIQPGDQCELITEVCNSEATVIHHTKGRIGKLLRDKRYWKKSCPPCNIHVENKDGEAREKGLKLSKHEPNYKREK